MKQKPLINIVVFGLSVLALLISPYSTKAAPSTFDMTSPTAAMRFSGPFQNTSLGIGGTVILDMNITSTTVSGYINFTNDPDVGSLCGAGSFSGTRSGDDFQFSFTSNDSDPGCGGVVGTNFSVTGSFFEGAITNGQFVHSATGQGGTFSAKQTTRYNGTFSTNGYPGTVAIDITKNSSTMVTGYMNFTNDPGVGALCGAGSFRGSIDSNGNMSHDFQSNDPDSGCGFDDGLEFAVSALWSGSGIYNGNYTVVDTGQSGTFSTACTGGLFTRLLTDIAAETYAEVCPVDTVLPTGNIIWPYDNENGTPPSYGPGDTIRIEAIASDSSGIYRVEFWVGYNGKWYRIRDEYFAPYEADFEIPANLPSQLIQIGIHVVDNFGNVAVDPGGKRYADYKISYNNPGVTENWIPAGNRAYLNQRSLTNGDSKCGASSAAMVLAMNGKIYTDYTHVAAVANEIYPNTIKDNQIWAYLVAGQMTARNLPSISNSSSSNNQWCIIRNEINVGHPVVMLSWKVTAGHFFVIVGYSEKAGDTSSRELIVYDPYGKWKGTTQGDYYVNTTSSSSHKGQWVYYDFTAARSDWMIVSSDAEVNNPCETPNAAFSVTSVPTTPADIVSDEEDISGFFAGVDVMASFSIYLPLVLK